MASSTTQRFMDALQETETSGEVDALVALFAEDATLRRMAQDDPYQGKEEATTFWREYLSVFAEVKTTFTNTVEADSTAVLEWRSEGRFPTGKALSYQGVSILELKGERVTAFRTYYDSAVFVDDGASH